MRRLWINTPTRSNTGFCQCNQLPTPRIPRIDTRSQRYTMTAATMACENNNKNNNTMFENTNNTTSARRNINKHRSTSTDFLEYLTKADRPSTTEYQQQERHLFQNNCIDRSVTSTMSAKKDRASALSDFYRSLATQDIDSIWPKYSYLYHHQYHKNLTRRNFRQLFLSAIRSRSTQRNLQRLLVLIDDMKERGMPLKCNEYDALMHWIGGRTVPVKKSHHLTEALALFDEMQQQTIQPSLVTYNTLIHIASQVSDIRMAQRLYHDMIAHDIKPDAYTYATLLSSMGKMRDVDGMEQMLEQLQTMQHVANNTVIWNAVLSGYAASDRIDDVKKMFGEMYNSLQQNKRYNNTPKEQQQQQQNGPEEEKEKERKAPVADTQSFRIYIEALLSQGEQDTAIRVLENMIRHDLEPIAAIYNQLFRSFMNEEAMEEEEDNGSHRNNDGLILDEETQTKLNTVKKLQQSMVELNVPPNSETMYTLVSALLDLGDTNLALETFVRLNRNMSNDVAVNKDRFTLKAHDTVALLTQRRFELDTTKPNKLEPNQELLERLGKIVK